MSAKDQRSSSLLKGLASVFERLRSSTRSSFNLRTTSVTATSVIIKVNGIEQSLNSHSGIESIREMAAEAGIPLDEVLALIQSSGTLANSPHLAQSSGGERVIGPVTMTACSKCHRKVPQSVRCLYCGQVLESRAASVQPANEVDKKFLETNVVEEGQATAKQQLRDTYEDRLKNL